MKMVANMQSCDSILTLVSSLGNRSLHFVSRSGRFVWTGGFQLLIWKKGWKPLSVGKELGASRAARSAELPFQPMTRQARPAQDDYWDEDAALTGYDVISSFRRT